MKKTPFLAVLLLFCGLTSCSTTTLPSSRERWHLPPKLDSEVSIMHFNVENLFDTEHDPDRNDETYLPKSQKQTPEHRALCAKMSTPYYKFECLNKDYTEDVVKQKMSNLSQVILEVDTHGPDVLVLEEVENIKILSRLNAEFLQTAGYKTIVLIEGPDRRGVDIGLLSRLPLAGEPVLHKPQIITDQDQQDHADHTRGILDVPLRLPTGDVLFVLGVHFPSPRNPRPWREQMLTQLINLAKAKGEKALVIAGGDLNITAAEEKEAHLLDKMASPVMMVSHFVGCQKCPGTNAYRTRWSFLDVQLYSKSLSETGEGAYKLLPETIDVVRYNPIHIYRNQYPLRWNDEKKVGVSDHFPIYSRIKIRNPSLEKSSPPGKPQEPRSAPETRERGK